MKEPRKIVLYLCICASCLYLITDEFLFVSTSFGNLHQHRRISEIPDSWPPEALLNKTASDSKRIVVAAVTCGYLYMADNFVQSLERLNVMNYLLVPLDEASHSILIKAYPDHTAPMMPGIYDIPSEATFRQTKDFQTITATRPVFLESLLKKGYTVLYSDVDRVWLQNVFTEFDRMTATKSDHDNVSLIVVDDMPFALNNDTESNNYSTSFMYLEPTEANLKLLREWHNAILADDSVREAGDQSYFNQVFKSMKTKQEILPKDWTKANTGDFPTGNDFFFGYMNYSIDDHDVQVVHANYMIGKKKKRQRLLEHGYWSLSGKIPHNITC